MDDRGPIPTRPGPRPRTTPTNPHTRLDQQPTDPRVRAELARQVFALPGVEERPTGISVPGARALLLEREAARGPVYAPRNTAELGVVFELVRASHRFATAMVS